MGPSKVRICPSFFFISFFLFLFQWNPLAALKAFSGNSLLKTTAKITLLYYTSVWAVVSTLMVYVARQFHFGPVKVRRGGRNEMS